MRVLIYGGTFNPPHLGHVRSLERAGEKLNPDLVLWVPASIPPHKAMAEESPSAAERLAMTELAAKCVPGSRVVDLELHREGKSYTSDTLRQLRAQYPEDELVFLLGTDMLLTLELWHEPEVVLSLASIALFARETDRTEEIAAAADRLRERYGARVYVLSGEPVEISSTEVRGLLKERRGREYLPEAVYARIIQKRLYGAKPDFSWLRERAHSYLKPKRVPHVLGTEQEAVRLAERWGQSAEEAAEAAICHDITKKLPLPDQLALCKKYGLVPDAYEQRSEKLLHARTGAAFAADLFGLSASVSGAIRWHTTGRADMTDLQKILYLADYIEPTRSGFDGLAELRRTAYENLDQAMELALRMSLADLAERNQTPHENSAQAHVFYRERLQAAGLEPVRADGVPDAPG